MKEIVAYAAERGITVIPEIDLPGHMVAALAAYPELGCTGGPYEVWTRWGVAPDILCAGNEDVYKFLEAVLTEAMDIFPSEYIHIGGDEAFNEEMGIPWDHCPKCAAKMRELGIVKTPADLGIDVATATRERLAAKNIMDLVEWSGGLYDPPAKFLPKKDA